MQENPYQPPNEPLEPSPTASPAKQSGWHPLTWGLIGVAAGTIVASPFMLCTDHRACVEGGAIFGGLPLGLYALMSAAERPRDRGDT